MDRQRETESFARQNAMPQPAATSVALALVVYGSLGTISLVVAEHAVMGPCAPSHAVERARRFVPAADRDRNLDSARCDR